MIIIDFGALEQQHSVRPQQLGLKTTSSTNGVLAVKYLPLVSSRFTIRSSTYSSSCGYPVSIRDCLQGHVCSCRGVFSWKTPNHSLGPQISIYLQNTSTILIIGIILQYLVIIRSCLAHPKQFSALWESRGCEKLNLQFNSLACLLISELLHVSGILSGIGRLPLLQILTCIRHFLH